MKSVMFVVLLATWVVLVFHACPLKAEHLTVVVDSRQEQCFFLEADEGQVLTIDYIVVATMHGPLEINFQLMDSINRPMLTEFRKSKSSQKFNLILPGVYKACFDNTYGRSLKHVNFIFALDADVNKADWHDFNINNLVPISEKQAEENKVIDASLDRIRVALQKIEVHQAEMRHAESRDRSTRVNSFEIVNFWSMVTLVTMIVIGLVQVKVVRMLFGDQIKNVFEYINRIENHRLIQSLKGPKRFY